MSIAGALFNCVYTCLLVADMDTLELSMIVFHLSINLLIQTNSTVIQLTTKSSMKYNFDRFFHYHIAIMAHKVYIGQQFEDFFAFESAIQKYQDAEKVQLFQERLTVFKSCKGLVSNNILTRLCEIINRLFSHC